MLHRVPDRWGTGCATLLGDAAHVFPPTQAQGANQALEDAWLLANALRRGGTDIPALLRKYEATRARRVRRVSRLAATENTNKPVSPVTAFLARLVPPRLLGTVYARAVRSFSSVLTAETV